MDVDITTRGVLTEVWTERVRQDERWGEQNHPDGTSEEFAGVAAYITRQNDKLAEQGAITWKDILHEEVLEAFAETDVARLRTELVQVAAVAVAWVEAIDRKAPANWPANWPDPDHLTGPNMKDVG